MESAPVFVKISKYRELSGILRKIQMKLDTANKRIDELQKLKDEEDARLQEWHENLSLVQGKLDTVTTALHQHK